jgi:hypothetical protein
MLLFSSNTLFGLLNFSLRTRELKYIKQQYCQLYYMLVKDPLTLQEERRIRIFENRILRPIFRSSRNKNGKWRRLHNEELYSLWNSRNIFRIIKSRRLRLAGHVTRMEEGRSAFKNLTGKPTGKIHLGKYSRRWEENIRMYFN